MLSENGQLFYKYATLYKLLNWTVAKEKWHPFVRYFKMWQSVKFVTSNTNEKNKGSSKNICFWLTIIIAWPPPKEKF